MSFTVSQRQASERVLQKLQEHPDAWTRVDSVLEHSKSQQAKFYALQVYCAVWSSYWQLILKCRWSLRDSPCPRAACVLSLLQGIRKECRMTQLPKEGQFPVAALSSVPSSVQALSTHCRLLFCLQILENVIKHRWGAIDDTQRAGIRNFVSNLIIKLSSDEQLFRQEKVYLNKLNIALVQVGMPVYREQVHSNMEQMLAITQCLALPGTASTSAICSTPISKLVALRVASCSLKHATARGELLYGGQHGLSR